MSQLRAAHTKGDSTAGLGTTTNHIVLQVLISIKFSAVVLKEQDDTTHMYPQNTGSVQYGQSIIGSVESLNLLPLS